jgi:hypothetical protein
MSTKFPGGWPETNLFYDHDRKVWVMTITETIVNVSTHEFKELKEATCFMEVEVYDYENN